MKCLMKSLAAVVNNPNLKKFDTVIVRMRMAGNYTMSIPGCYCRITNGYFSDDTYTLEDGTEGYKSGTIYMVTTGEATIELSEYSSASGTFKASSSKYVVDINDILSNTDTRLTMVQLGYDGTSTSGNGAVIRGDFASVVPFVQKLVVSGCTGAVRGFTIDNMIINYATAENLTHLNIYATPITLHTEALEGKYYLTILPSNVTRGEFKYFADVVNTTIQFSNTGLRYVTGSVEDYIHRVFENEATIDPEIYPARRSVKIRVRPTMGITLGGVPVIQQISSDPLPTYVTFSWGDNYLIDGEITVTTS